MKIREPNAFYKLLHIIYRFRPVSWLISVIIPPMDKFIFKISKKKFSLAQILSGLPIVLVHTTGAKTGKERDIPLIAIPFTEQRDHLALIASNWGNEKNPGWYYNLKAHPNISISYQGETQQYHSQEIDDQEEYDEIWETAVSYYSGYNNYKKRTSREKIPIFKLSPKN